MIELSLSVEVLGRTRFAYSPLSEVAGSLRTLGSTHPDFTLLPWVRQVREGTGIPRFDLLRAVAPPGPAAPSFLFASSVSCGVGNVDQLASLAGVSTAELERDLACVWPTGQRPSVLQAAIEEGALGARLAECVWDYWQLAISPYWSRLRSVIDDSLRPRPAGSRTA